MTISLKKKAIKDGFLKDAIIEFEFSKNSTKAMPVLALEFHWSFAARWVF